VDEYPDAVEIAMRRYTAVISERTGTDAADIEAIVAHETRWKAMMEDMQRGEPPLTE
jgi:hypothetical protein